MSIEPKEVRSGRSVKSTGERQYFCAVIFEDDKGREYRWLLNIEDEKKFNEIVRLVRIEFTALQNTIQEWVANS